MSSKKLENAVEALEHVMRLPETSLELRVSALEALAMLKLRMHLDDDAVGLAQAGFKLVETDASGTDDQQLQFRTTMTRDLVKVASGDLESADSHVRTDENFGIHTNMTPVAGLASAMLALAECTHVQGSLLQAKTFYEDAIKFANSEIDELLPALTAVSTTPEEVRIGALVGLGQLRADLSEFDEAERNLTEALKQAETLGGENHVRVGLVLSCMGHLYARRAKVENTGYLLAEGLYRRSLDLLEAPPIDNEDFQPAKDLLDILALSRARYADLLATNNRTNESERLRLWANSSWKGTRPLDDILSESTIPKPLSVVEVRLGRVL
ncbi:hypothetical protein O6H91_20G075000 [Diphasiastrum complanatum]|uniref:Uncharacterized protein n=1 Tax=Diphasiastrum complanatum TaxID=34168 RepID=A0ACC2ARP7_DIPCM|nr:hypothetical protein O6H91_20G075000 [Diphasiastrum complanatum]